MQLISTKRHLLQLGSLAAVLSFAATGCISQTDHDDLHTLYRQQQEQIIDLRSQIEERDAQISFLSSDKGQIDREMSSLVAERDRLQQLLFEAEAQLRQGPVVVEKEVVVRVTPEVDSALRSLASANPNLMVYDSELGMIRLKSDLTFALGSTAVREAAVSALGRLAQVLNDEASQYHIRIVGHTDNVPVRNSANRAKFEDNWGLSAFRAISVQRVLSKAGVNHQRIIIAGRGQYSPVVENGPGGAEANRRVEIYLVEAIVPTIDASANVSDVPNVSNETGQVLPATDEPATQPGTTLYK